MWTYAWSIICLGILLVAHIIGNELGLYVSVDSYDVYMHLFGGLGIGLAIIAITKSDNYIKIFSRYNVIAVVLIIGVIWEAFEAHYHIAGAPIGTKLYYIDTTKDLINDTVGGVLAIILAYPRAKIV